MRSIKHKPLINQNEQNSTGDAISELNKTAEYIFIKNSSASAVDLNGWKIESVRGNQLFTFPAFSLAAGASVKIGDSASNASIDFHWLDGGGKWNNSESDPAKLYYGTGKQVEALNN